MPPVVVPLDGSPRAETALAHARAIARGAPLTLVTTMWGRDGDAPRKYLEQQAAALADIEVKTTVIGDREAADAILLVSRELPGSTICMATHGRSGLGEAVLGSVAESVVRGAESPVMLVGPHAAPEPSPSADLVVAVENPETASAITPAAAALASALTLKAWAVEVVAPAPVPFSTEVDLMGWPGDGAGAEAAVGALESLGCRAESKVLRDPDPAAAIVRFVRELPAAFVVVGTHARQGLARVALGSVAMQVVHRSPCPVLVVRS
jgi:nucleotide-binding universal stress UspA family protein